MACARSPSILSAKAVWNDGNLLLKPDERLEIADDTRVNLTIEPLSVQMGRMQMPISKCHGIVRGRSVVLDKAAQLREGTRVLVIPVNEERGSPAAVLAALAGTPIVSPEDVDELERLIEAGKRPLSRRNPLIPKRLRKKS